MSKIPWLLAALAALGLLAACQSARHHASPAPAPADDDAADDDSSPDDDATAADDDSAPPYVQKYQFALAIEVQFQATLKLAQNPNGNLTAAFIPQQGFDVLLAGTTLLGSGQLWSIPEANGRMVMLRLNGPAAPNGPCGNNPISYAVSLTAKASNAYMVGGLTAYCGANTFTGSPARVMRLAGWQTKVE